MRKEACRVFKIDYDEMNERHRLKVAAVSNEGRELTVHRVRTFGLGRIWIPAPGLKRSGTSFAGMTNVEL